MAFHVNGAPVESGGPADRLLSWDRVRDMTGISRSTAWRLSHAGAFPSRVSISPGRVGWWESELTAWKALRGSAQAIDPPGRMARKGLEPPMRPRLPGMARASPTRTAPPATATAQSAQPDLTPPAPAPVGFEAAQAANPAPDQIDFGF
ncbi:helix-turn-helix transcriptional regulator [Brevundimonas goettingensis]|uniref:AlpA family phage regulatory protein n=1 Tax=Brevundimonas goettingensis TaxID=2774190 RepID=A0A975C2R3_9CAUL|nr:AlpA family phage regulatory protein [Brevundimonas goettingensis]QTC92788.1 AlpA family phage regulatory protein [Brevundimonas goettingensis]